MNVIKNLAGTKTIYEKKVLFPILLLATPLILLTLVVIPTTQRAYAQEAEIRLFQCNNGMNAHWLDEDETLKDTITYKIIVTAPRIQEPQIDTVREGVERWDGFVYNIEEVSADEDADIEVILVIGAQLSGSGGVYTYSPEDTECTVYSGFISISMKGALASPSDIITLEDLAMHEMGHALGLGHTNFEQDVMFTRRAGEYCPSNLDIDGLTAEESRYSIEDWVELNC
jgi:hypothetical protein